LKYLRNDVFAMRRRKEGKKRRSEFEPGFFDSEELLRKVKVH
jgi:hypothetical protein